MPASVVRKACCVFIHLVCMYVCTSKETGALFSLLSPYVTVARLRFGLVEFSIPASISARLLPTRFLFPGNTRIKYRINYVHGHEPDEVRSSNLLGNIRESDDNYTKSTCIGRIIRKPMLALSFRSNTPTSNALSRLYFVSSSRPEAYA